MISQEALSIEESPETIEDTTQTQSDSDPSVQLDQRVKFFDEIVHTLGQGDDSTDDEISVNRRLDLIRSLRDELDSFYLPFLDAEKNPEDADSIEKYNIWVKLTNSDNPDQKKHLVDSFSVFIRTFSKNILLDSSENTFRDLANYADAKVVYKNSDKIFLDIRRIIEMMIARNDSLGIEATRRYFIAILAVGNESLYDKFVPKEEDDIFNVQESIGSRDLATVMAGGDDGAIGKISELLGMDSSAFTDLTKAVKEGTEHYAKNSSDENFSFGQIMSELFSKKETIAAIDKMAGEMKKAQKGNKLDPEFIKNFTSLAGSNPLVAASPDMAEMMAKLQMK